LNNAINRANFDTLVGIEVAFALNTFVGVDLENYVAFENSLGGANWFTSGARNAIV